MTRRRLVTLAALAVLGVGPAVAQPGPQDGAAIFKTRCASCHGELGRTDSPDARSLKVRPLAGDARLAAMSPADLVQAIKSDPKHQGLDALTASTTRSSRRPPPW